MKRVFLALLALAMCLSVFAACTPEETDIAVTKIVISSTAETLEIGTKLTLEATVLPQDATDKTVSWSSSAAEIATVNDGIVTAVSAGEATITAQSGDIKAACDITVVAIGTTWYNPQLLVLNIKNSGELTEFAHIVNGTSTTFAKDSFAGKTVNLTADIDLAGAFWTPIGTVVEYSTPTSTEGKFSYAYDVKNPFEGTFNGKKDDTANYSISNLTLVQQGGSGAAATNATSINGSGALALFGATRNATLKNVNLKNVAITRSNGTETLIAPLVGLFAGNGSIENIQTDGKIVANVLDATDVNIGKTVYVGGIAAKIGLHNNKALVAGKVSVKECVNNTDLEGKLYNSIALGGIVGWNGSITAFENCINNGDITTEGGAGGHGTGGIAGFINSVAPDNEYVPTNEEWVELEKYKQNSQLQSSVVGCINNGDISANMTTSANVGGIIGTLYHNYRAKDPTVGVNMAFYDQINPILIKDSVNKGNVASAKISGGIVGYGNERTYATIQGCTNEGNVSGGSNIGGMAGTLFGDLIDCTNKGNITASGQVSLGVATLQEGGSQVHSGKFSISNFKNIGGELNHTTTPSQNNWDGFVVANLSTTVPIDLSDITVPSGYIMIGNLSSVVKLNVAENIVINGTFNMGPATVTFESAITGSGNISVSSFANLVKALDPANSACNIVNLSAGFNFTDNLTVAEGKTLKLGANANLSVRDGFKLTNNGTIDNSGFTLTITATAKDSSFENNGTITGSGAFTLNANTVSGADSSVVNATGKISAQTDSSLNYLNSKVNEITVLMNPIIAANFEIAVGKTWIMNGDRTITVRDGMKLTNSGNITSPNAKLTIMGNSIKSGFINNGLVKVDEYLTFSNLILSGNGTMTADKILVNNFAQAEYLVGICDEVYINANISLTKDFTLAQGKKWIFTGNRTIDTKTFTLTNNGTILGDGNISLNNGIGILVNNGSININGTITGVVGATLTMGESATISGTNFKTTDKGTLGAAEKGAKYKWSTVNPAGWLKQTA